MRLVVGLLFLVGLAGLFGCRSRQERWWEEREYSLRRAEAMQTQRRVRELASVGKVLATIACQCREPVTVWLVDPSGGRAALCELPPGGWRQVELAAGSLQELVCLAPDERVVAYRCRQRFDGNYLVTVYE